MDSYRYTEVASQVSSQDIVFSNFEFENRTLRLAHFILPDGLRLEVSETSIGVYSVMRIEKDGDRDWYFLQESLDNVASIINHCLSEATSTE